MEAQYRTKNGKLSFKIVGDGVKDIIAELTQIEQVFGEGSVCGACESGDTRFQQREAKGFTFYEAVCNACHCKLSFGQSKDTVTLFPKKRDGDTWLPNHGWQRYESGSAD